MKYNDQIRQMAETCRSDPAFIMGIKAALLESGLATMCDLIRDESKLDPFRACPADWTAMQIAFFDNGVIPPCRNRPKIQRTKMRYGGNIMVWTRDDINFNLKGHVAWQANVYLWTAAEAREIARDLRDEKYVDDATVALVDEMTENAAPHARFSIPLLKNKTATKWMKSHLVITSLQDDRPDTVAVLFPEITLMTNKSLVDYLADGQSLSGKAILQARIARNPALGQWATEVNE